MTEKRTSRTVIRELPDPNERPRDHGRFTPKDTWRRHDGALRVIHWWDDEDHEREAARLWRQSARLWRGAAITLIFVILAMATLLIVVCMMLSS